MPMSSDELLVAPATQLTGLGAVGVLEARLAEYYGMRYAVAMPSATTGLMALGLALDLRSGDFVSSPLTYGGSIAAWLALGGSARFADVDRDSLTLAPASIASALTPATRAILAVDLFGHPCDDDALRSEADRCGVWLVVDAAQSLGARINGRPAGSLADAVVVSFTTGKALDVGEGGAVLTNRRDLYERIIWHSQHPYRQKRELGLHRVNELAINGRIHPGAARQASRQLDAALGRVAERRDLFDRLRQALGSVPEIDVPLLSDGVEPSYYRLTVRRGTPNADEAIRRCLLETGIGGSAGPLPVSILYRQPGFAREAFSWARNCPVAEREWTTRICVWPAEHSLSPSGSVVDGGRVTA